MLIDNFSLFLADGFGEFGQRCLLDPSHAAEAADEFGLGSFAHTFDVEQLAADLAFAPQRPVEGDAETVRLVADVHQHFQRT